MYNYEDIKSRTINDRDTDIYVTYKNSDRIDNMANKYYKDPSLFQLLELGKLGQ